MPLAEATSPIKTPDKRPAKILSNQVDGSLAATLRLPVAGGLHTQVAGVLGLDPQYLDCSTNFAELIGPVGTGHRDIEVTVADRMHHAR